MNKLNTIFCLILLFCGFCEPVLSNQSQTQNSNTVEIARDRDSTSRGQVLPITAQAIIKKTIIELEVAQTPEQQAKGLMFREALPDNRGMLFPFQQPKIARFWMHNVPVALDMVFIKEGQIIAISEAVPPCTTQPQDCPVYGPDTAVDGVIELRAKRAKELKLVVGDSIAIRSLDTLPQK